MSHKHTLALAFRKALSDVRQTHSLPAYHQQPELTKKILTEAFRPITFHKTINGVDKYIVVKPIMHIGPDYIYTQLFKDITTYLNDSHHYKIHLEGVGTRRKIKKLESIRNHESLSKEEILKLTHNEVEFSISPNTYSTLGKVLGFTSQPRFKTAQENGLMETHDLIINDLKPKEKIKITLFFTFTLPVVFSVLAIMTKVPEISDFIYDSVIEVTQKESQRTLFKNIMQLRENIAINAAQEALDTHNGVLMVWGQAHLKNFRKLLLSQGFTELS